MHYKILTSQLLLNFNYADFDSALEGPKEK